MSRPNRALDASNQPRADLFEACDPSEPMEVRMARTARQRLSALLDEARDAARTPWDAQKTEVNALVFHNMANWLPAGERESLRAEFRNELARLSASD